MKLVATSLSLVTAALAASRTSAPSGCLEVKSGGTYTTIQKAVDALSTSSTTAQCIFVNSGTYKEQVVVSSRKAQLTIYGYTTDTSSYSSNTVTITNSKSQADGLNNDQTGTLRVAAANFKLYNVNVANTHGKGSQAVAISAQANSGYYGCQITGYQDTLYANAGAQVYAHSMIEGVTDFIFGSAQAWFEKVDIRVLASSIGYVTASGRGSSSSSGWYCFDNCDIAALSGQSVSSGAYYLGRPWGTYARVTFQKTSMSSVINSAGWHNWHDDDTRTANADFEEYANTGAGASGTRASFSKKLSSAVSISTVLGSSYASQGYYDASYMS